MCDTMVVVWPGKVGFAKNSDRDPNEAQRLQWIPSAEHRADAILRCTWMAVPQVRRTRAVLLSRPFWTWGAEMGTNDAGLVIGNEAVFTNKPMDEPGLTGLDLVRLGLERSQSTEQAIETISALVHQHGQGGRASYSHPSFQYHNSFIVADAHGAAVLETAGREVAVERVANGARAISNGLTISSMQKHSDRLRSKVAQCTTRRSLMERIGAAAAGPSELATALRSHGSDGYGQDLPRFGRLTGALSAPCVHYGGLVAGSQTVASWISILTTDCAQHWATGTSSPCISLFRPISIDRPRDTGDSQGYPDSSSLWWRFESLHRQLMLDWPASAAMLEERNAIEQSAFENPEDADAHWQAADRWLDCWRDRFRDLTDGRPKWLKRLWQHVEAEAQGGNRLPARQ